jgi:hypothetical protein
MSNAENSAALRDRLGALKTDAASNVLGHALNAWAKETKQDDPFPTPSAAAQMFGILRKGATVGETTYRRIDPFLSMLAGVNDPDAVIQELSLRNGHVPIHGTQNGSEPQVQEPEAEEQEMMVFHIDPAMRELLQPIVERYEIAQGKVDEQQAILDGLKKESSTLLNMLKAAGVVERKKYTPQKPKPEPKKKKQNHVSETTAMEILEKVRRYMADGHEPALPDVPASFTRPEIEKALGLHHSQVGAAVEWLRERGQVRAAGITTNGIGQKVNVYALA